MYLSETRRISRALCTCHVARLLSKPKEGEGRRRVTIASGTDLVLSYLSHFDSSRRDPANSRRIFTNARRLPVCGLCLTVRIRVCVCVGGCLCVCVVGGRVSPEQDKQGPGSPNASTSGAVASSSSLPSTLWGTPSVQFTLVTMYNDVNAVEFSWGVASLLRVEVCI